MAIAEALAIDPWVEITGPHRKNAVGTEEVVVHYAVYRRGGSTLSTTKTRVKSLLYFLAFGSTSTYADQIYLS